MVLKMAHGADRAVFCEESPQTLFRHSRRQIRHKEVRRLNICRQEQCVCVTAV